MKNQAYYVKHALLTYGRFVDKTAWKRWNTSLVQEPYDGATLESRFRELMLFHLAIKPR